MSNKSTTTKTLQGAYSKKALMITDGNIFRKIEPKESRKWINDHSNWEICDPLLLDWETLELHGFNQDDFI